KTIQRVERPHERVLHQLVDLVSFSRRNREPSERRCVSSNQGAGRSLVAGFPTSDELRIQPPPIVGFSPGIRRGAAVARRVAHSVQTVDVTGLAPLRSRSAGFAGGVSNRGRISGGLRRTNLSRLVFSS